MEPAFVPLGHLGLDELIESIAAALFHAFKAEAQVYWEIQPKAFVRLKHVQPPKDRALVVCGAATDQTSTFLILYQFEGFGVPAIALFCLDDSS